MKKKYIVIGGLFIAFAAACIFGGQELSQYLSDKRTTELQGQGQLTTQTPETPSPTVSITPLVKDPVTYTPPAATPDNGVQVEETEDGTLVITPNWPAPPANSAAPTANISSGGGNMNLEDGVYHGEKVDPTPTPKPSTTTPTPAPVATPTATTKPTEKAPATEPPTVTPKPTPDPTQPPATPAPSQPSGGGSTPPPDSGNHKDGEISSNGRYEYWEGFGWVDRSSTTGGTGGDDSDLVTGGLSGEKIGEM